MLAKKGVRRVKRSKNVSSRDVAREVGVSQATVSYVLNNVPGIKIKPETRQAVLEAAKRLNYHPNLIAKSMRLQKSMSIGVVSDKNVSSYWFMKVLEGIKDAVSNKNYSITLCFNKTLDDRNAEHLNYYRSNRIDGIIFAFSSLSDGQIAYMLDNNIPFVVIHSNVKNEMVRVVKTDMTNAMLQAVMHLKEQGFEKIAYLSTGSGDKWDRRYPEYVKAIEGCGMKVHDDLVVRFDAFEEGTEGIFDGFMAKAQVPCAVISDSNNLAFSLLKYAARKGIKVPEQLAVIAIGSSRFADLSYPSLSTVQAPLYEMGYKGAEMLFDIMDGNIINDVVTLEWSFAPRDSSKLNRNAQL